MMQYALKRCGVAVALLGVMLCHSARGQERPGIGYFYPPCGAPGQTVELQIGGYDTPVDTQFFVRDGKAKLDILGPPGEMIFPGPPHYMGPRAVNNKKPFPIPREIPARLKIPSDARPGVIRLQAANANGASGFAEFLVTAGPAPILEENCQLLHVPASGEIGQRELAVRQLPPLPLHLCGRIQKKEETDRFRFIATTTGLLTCRLPRHSFGTAWNPVLKIEDASGRVVADAADTEGVGLATTFAAIAGEHYRITLFDLDYRGDRSMVYALSLAHAPHVVAAMPAMLERGKTQSVTFIGYGVATGKPLLESTERQVTPPASMENDRHVYSLETPFGIAAPYALGLSDLAEGVEPDNSPAATPLDLPGAVTGRLATFDEEDVYTFTAEKNDSWSFTLSAAAIGSPLDVSLKILDSNDKAVGSNDDVRGSTDAALAFRATAPGEYRVVVSDLSGSSGRLDSLYRLSAIQPVYDFEIVPPDFAESYVGDPAFEVPANGRVKAGQIGVLAINFERLGVFNEPIQVFVTDLPPGVTAPEEVIVGERKKQAHIPLTCDAAIASFAGVAQIRAVGTTKDGERLEETAEVLIAPVMKPRAVVRPLYPDAGRTVHRGATYPAPLVLTRLEDYTGAVELQMASRPDRVRQGIIGPEVIVAPDVEELKYPLFLPEWVQTDRTSRIVINTVIDLPDGQGNVRQLINRMDRRITMNVEGAFLKLSATQASVVLKNGQATIPLEILRSPKLQGPVRIRLAGNVDYLAPPSEQTQVTGPFIAEPLEMPPTAATGELQISTNGESLAPGDHELTIEAYGVKDGLLVVSQTKVIIETPR